MTVNFKDWSLWKSSKQFKHIEIILQDPNKTPAENTEKHEDIHELVSSNCNESISSETPPLETKENEIKVSSFFFSWNVTLDERLVIFLELPCCCHTNYVWF